jgi:hypothetical protein
MISPVKGKPEIVAQYTDPSGQFTVSIQMISPVKGKSDVTEITTTKKKCFHSNDFPC